MFGSLGAPEILVIFLVVLIVFRPSKLPAFGKSVGEAIRGLKNALSEPEKTRIENSQSTVDTDESSQPSLRIGGKA